MNDVEVACLPKNLPEYLEVDVTDLELDAMLHLSDIKLPEGVEIPQLAQGPETRPWNRSIHVIKAAPIEDEVVEAKLRRRRRRRGRRRCAGGRSCRRRADSE